MGKGKEGKREKGRGDWGVKERDPSPSLPPSTFSLSRSSSLFPFVAPVTQAHIVLQLHVRLVPLKYSYFGKGCRKKCARDNPER